MARVLSSTVANSLTQFITRRCYASAGPSVRSSVSAANVEEKVIRKTFVDSSSSANSWIPDPVTGYYRPANRRVEVDAADLRKTLLANKK